MLEKTCLQTTMKKYCDISIDEWWIDEWILETVIGQHQNQRNNDWKKTA